MDAPAAIDSHRIAQVAAALGRDRYAALLDQLLASLAGLVAEPRAVHRLAGSAGTLGLIRLAARLKAAEAALVAGTPPRLGGIAVMAADDAEAARQLVVGGR